nr:hypothetical protein [Adlercreutzia equolifaciens]
MALQKLGCSCHTQNPAPATTMTAATTPATIHPRLGRFLGAGPPAAVAEPAAAAELVSVAGPAWLGAPAALFSSSMLMIASSLPCHDRNDGAQCAPRRPEKLLPQRGKLRV